MVGKASVGETRQHTYIGITGAGPCCHGIGNFQCWIHNNKAPSIQIALFARSGTNAWKFRISMAEYFIASEQIKI